MSYVTIIIIHDNYIYRISTHYRNIIGILKKDIKTILPLLRNKIFLDGGYIIYDLNKRQAINSQDCFPIEAFVNEDVLNI